MDDSERADNRLYNRFAAADFMLSKLDNGEFRHRFPNLAKFLKNSRFDAYEITDVNAFEHESAEPDVEKLLHASRFRGTVHLSMEPFPKIRLFYEKDLTEAESALLAHSQQKIAALAFAALGLDLSGLNAAEQEKAST